SAVKITGFTEMAELRQARIRFEKIKIKTKFFILLKLSLKFRKMKNRISLFLVSFFCALNFLGCKDDDSGLPPSASVNDFVWKAMNLWYYWQAESPDLADNRFSSDAEYTHFLNSQPTDDLFYNLLFDYGNTDRFSWIVDDYEVLDNSFAGINLSFGMDYGLVYIESGSNLLLGYVQYVLPNSPAANAGFQRGDIFTRINGTPLTDSNYSQLLG